MDEFLGFVFLSGPIFFVAVFFVLSIIVVIVAYRFGKKPGRWTLIAILLLWFWDLPVVWGIYHYQCAVHGGFTKYKSLEQWKKENPSAAATLTPYDNPDPIEKAGRIRYPLNQRFAWEIASEDWPLMMRRSEERIVDTATGEVLARYVDIRSGKDWFRSEHNWWNPREYKFWLNVGSCEPSVLPEKIKFNGYQQSINMLGRAKDESN